MFKTGILARFRLWRTLRAARIFNARGQTPEALRAWRMALQIFPGASEARYGLALDSIATQLSELGSIRPQLQTVLDREGSWTGDGLKERLAHAEGALTIARADWQSARRQMSLRVANIEHQLNGAHAHWGNVEAEFRSRLADVLNSNDQTLQVNRTLDAQVRALSGSVARTLEHFTTLKALSLRVAKQTTHLSIHDAAIDALGKATSDEAAASQQELAERLELIERTLSRQDARLSALSLIAHVDPSRDPANNVPDAGPTTKELSAQLSLATHADAISVQSYLAERLEFIRRELMFEFHHGPRHSAGLGGEPRVVTAVLNPAKLETQRKSGLRVNLGCGHIPLPGFINIDRREIPGVDIVAEADDLPFEPASLTHIHSAHFLEHFPQETLSRTLLPYLRELLVENGTFSAVVPDGAAMMRAWSSGDYEFEELREVLFGAQDYIGDYHFTLFTPESLTGLLESAGFVNIEIVREGERNGKCFEMELQGRRA